MAKQKNLVSAEQHVFINCPFDKEYRSLRDALVFAVFDCGFIPRCALERDDSDTVRIEKISQIITECRYGIHDLSRVEVEPNGVPRFNMPLELGLFMGCQRYGGVAHRNKRFLVLDAVHYQYQRSTSDISGQDIKVHEGRETTLIGHVRDWLSGKRQIAVPSGSVIAARYSQFRDELPDLCARVRQKADELTFLEYVGWVEEWLELVKSAGTAPQE
jgi:hypothetical protein